MSLFTEFKEFAVKGNVVDIGVGLVVGAAFTSVVNSLVANIINPVIGVVTGGIDFSNLFLNLSRGYYETLTAAKAAGAATLNYGLFINSLISFMIVGWLLFFVIRSMNTLRRLVEETPDSPETPPPPRQEVLLTQIRDLLAAAQQAPAPPRTDSAFPLGSASPGPKAP